MRLGNRMKRLSRRDVEELSAASVKLAQAAATIQRSGANYVPAVMQLLTEANDAIVGIRDRALATVKRVLEAMEDRADDAARAKAAEQPAAPAGWPGSGEQPKE
jgi:hypothetical protein